MTRHEFDPAYARHQEIWELLPWYVNQTLDEQELASVAQHLALCSACQDEVVRCQRIATAVHVTDETAWSPSPARFAALMAQIDTTVSVAPPPRTWWETLRHLLGRGGMLFAETPRLVRITLACESALIVLLFGVMMWQAQQTPPSLYNTLSTNPDHAPPAPLTAVALTDKDLSAPPRGQLRLVFTEHATERELRALLHSVQATIIAGPSPLGVYTVEAVLETSVPDPMQALLEVLRAHANVLLAEPVSGP